MSFVLLVSSDIHLDHCHAALVVLGYPVIPDFLPGIILLQIYC